ncbi:MAG: hypothetical protein JRI46_11545 [Deltaproteobacteria bacterium]|nr:hypothetical protein [Deltaproteobacteria bacterium]
MQRGKEKASAVRISLLDVMYGVVLAYGFGFFDKIEKIDQHVLLILFAYLIIVVDWIYVHNKYGDGDYAIDLFVLDILILFTISRLFALSMKDDYSWYWLCMNILFVFHIIWDVCAEKRRLLHGYNFYCSIGGDLIAALFFLIFYFLFLGNILQPTIFLNVIMILSYIIACLTWSKKFSIKFKALLIRTKRFFLSN